MLTVAIQPVNTFLIPDISGDSHTSPAVLKAARAAAAGLTTGELFIRTAAEIAGAWALCWIVNTIVNNLSKKAREVCNLFFTTSWVCQTDLHYTCFLN